MTTAKRELPEYQRVRWGRRVAMVHPDFVADLFVSVMQGWDGMPSELVGRGEMLEVSTEAGDVLIREYLRGGLAARVSKDAYLLDNRPRKELKVHCAAWRAGVPTVMPVGAMWERSGLLYRGAYATLRADAKDLLLYLQSHNQPDPSILAACGRAIRAMHHAGIYHADLQVKNLLVNEREALVIDFDGARMKRVTDSMAEHNLARLKRSFAKRGLPVHAFDAIVAAYYSSKAQLGETEN